MSVLTPAQEQFSSRLSSLTGLDKNVIRGWTLAEESDAAARTRVQQGNHNWLNIGYFDSGAGGLTKDTTWSNPMSAAQATADFLSGKRFGPSSGIRAILGYAGKSPQEQINAIAKSGWASSGYGGGSRLLATYGLVSGQKAPAVPGTRGRTLAGAPQPVATPEFKTIKTTGYDTGPKMAIDILDAKSAGEAKGIYKAAHAEHEIEMPVSVDESVKKSGVSPNATSVVELAKQYQGTPYVWGGTTPKGFDCSGFVQFLYAKKGVKVSRTTYTQVKEGTEVPINRLQPGDVLFFGSHDAPHHEGLYIGHGQFIHAPHTGDVVKISNLSDRTDFAQARRFG